MRTAPGARPSRSLWRRRAAAPAVASTLVVVLLALPSSGAFPAGPRAASAPWVGPAGPSCPGGPPGGCESAPTATAGGSGTWIDLTPTLARSPSARDFAASAFDPSLPGVVVFGGRSATGTALGDTWRFGGAGWSTVDGNGGGPEARWGAAVAYDPASAELVLFGGTDGSHCFGDTWVLNGSVWQPTRALGGPSARSGATMADDPALGGPVLFGGASASGMPENDTWVHRASGWSRLVLPPGAAPSPRTLAAAVYDPSTSALLVFGGTDGGGHTLFDPLWALTASGWQNLSGPAASVSGPGPRAAAAFAYSSLLGGAVLLGGDGSGPSSSTAVAGTWLYRSASWFNVTADVGRAPPSSVGASLVDDPLLGEAILFGGAAPAAVDETWALAPAPFSLVVTASPTAGPAPLVAAFEVSCAGGSPPYRFLWSFGDGNDLNGTANVSHAYGLPGNYSATLTVYDASGAGIVRTTPVEVLDTWAGAHQWANVGAGLPDAPSARSAAQFAYDPGLSAAILFGGEGPGGLALGDTWEFVNNVWIDLTAGIGPGPSPRWGGSFVTDPIDGDLVLFGGTNGADYLGDTWIFNGTGWHALSVRGPSPRADAQASFDAYDGYVLVFGGSSAGPAGAAPQVDADTWEFRAGVWENVTSQLTIAPAPTTGGVAVYDAAVSAVVLYGGSSISSGGAPGTCYPNGGTWRYASGTWSEQGGVTAPPSAILPAGGDDGVDAAVVLYGGSQSVNGRCVVTQETWAYTSGAWTNLTGPSVAAPLPRDGAAMAYDGAEGVLVLFGGSDAGWLLNDTWVFPTELNASSTTVTGNGTATTGSGSGGGGSGGSGGSGGGGSSGSGLPFAVGYSITSQTGAGPLTVTFLASSIGGVAPVVYAWNFGDSSPSVNGTEVVHRYAVPGSYDPVLTATDGAGEVLVRVLATIQVDGVGPPALTGSPTVAPPPPVSPALVAAALAVATVGVTLLFLAMRRREHRRRGGAGG